MKDHERAKQIGIELGHNDLLCWKHRNQDYGPRCVECMREEERLAMHGLADALKLQTCIQCKEIIGLPSKFPELGGGCSCDQARAVLLKAAPFLK